MSTNYYIANTLKHVGKTYHAGNRNLGFIWAVDPADLCGAQVIIDEGGTWWGTLSAFFRLVGRCVEQDFEDIGKDFS